MKALGAKPVVVNIADNSHGVAMSSVAASAAAIRLGTEPVLQMVTRDRNRIALQSDLLGAASLGIKNVLCLSGYHQTLIGCPESANVFDIDSTQFIQMAAGMSEQGVLADGTKIVGQFSMLVGAVANPFLKPLELNLFRLGKKIEAGARFIQTHAVFDIETFRQWLDAARKEGFTKKAAILASVMPLESAAEALKLRDTYAEFCIPDKIIERLKNAGDAAAQKKEGLAICVETIKQLKGAGRVARDPHSFRRQRSHGARVDCRIRIVIGARRYAGQIPYQNPTGPAATAAHRQAWRGGLARRLRPVP